MFRPMRRSRQVMPDEAVLALLDRNTSGVLALHGDDGYPYAVPLSYVRTGNTLYFHCARTGHKIDALTADSKASFCVIDQDLLVPEKFTTYFRSAILFGQAEVISDRDEIAAAIRLLCTKLSPGQPQDAAEKEIANEAPALCIVRFSIEHASGKEAIELVKARNNQPSKE